MHSVTRITPLAVFMSAGSGSDLICALCSSVKSSRFLQW